MSELITAEQARNLVAENATKSRYNDISKVQTIMKNIKERAKKGHSHYFYQAHVSKAMAKTLFDFGYQLYGKSWNDKYTIETFPEDRWGVIICWNKGGHNDNSL